MRLTRDWLWLGAIGAAGLVLRLVRLGHQSLWIDEVLSTTWIQEIHKRGFGSLWADIHGPLHALALYCMSLLSMQEWSLRLPSSIAGALAIPALGALGSALWGRKVGFTAAGLLAVSPFALYYSQECRSYAFSILFAILVLGAALAFVRRPSARGAALLGVAELASVLSNLNGIFFLLGLNVWLLLGLRAARRALLLWLACQAGLAVVLGTYGLEVQHQVRAERMVGVATPGFGEKEPLRGETTLHPMALPYTAFAFAAGYSLGPTLEELRLDPRAAARPRYWPILGMVVLGFGLPLVAGVSARAASAGRALLILPALTTAAFVLWLAATNMKPYNVRYLSVCLPAFLLFVALGLWTLPRRWGVLAAMLAGVASLWSCFDYLFVARYGRDDVRGVVQYLAAKAQPQDAVVQIALTGPLRYYYNQLGDRPVHPPAEAGASLEAAQRFSTEVWGAARDLWYIECRPRALDPHGYVREALQDSLPLVEKHSFTGIQLYRFSRDAAARSM